jgi:hypothetical protein
MATPESHAASSSLRSLAGLRRPFALTLAAALLAAVLAMLERPSRRSSPPVVAAAVPHPVLATKRADSGVSEKPIAHEDRSSALRPYALEAARGDPFKLKPQPAAPVVPIPVAPALPPTTITATAQPPAEPEPSGAPPMQHRYLGRLYQPDGGANSGNFTVFLTRTGTPVAATVGAVLDDGYVVHQLLANAVQLRHPPSGIVVEVELPPMAANAAPAR